MIYRNISLICFAMFLTACPYKEIYKPVAKNEININGIKISPVIVYYDSWKKVSTCDVIFTLSNHTSAIRRLIFSKSYLINLSDTLSLERINVLGNRLPVDHIFELYPNRDTSLGLYFTDLKSNFGDSIKVVLDISTVGNNTFIYKKTK